jgi:hypothetical protein
LIATAIVDGMPHLIAGSAFDVYVEIPGHDGDSVRHALSTVEDVAVNGTFPMRVLPRAQSTGTPLWSGSLFIGDLDADRRVVRMGAEAGSAAAKAGG